MSNRIAQRSWLLALVLPLALAAPASAQPKHAATYLNEAFTRVTDIAKALNQKLGYGYAKEANPSILVGWVNRGARLDFTWNLTAGVEYVLVADGDLDATDIDLQVFAGAGAVGQAIVQDFRFNREAVVNFTPKASGKFTARLILTSSANNVPCACAMVLMRKNGWNLPLGNLDSAMGALTKSMERVDDDLQKKLGVRLDIHKGDNQWAVFGGLADRNESIGVNRIAIGSGDRVIIGAGDRFTKQLDLDYLDDNNQVLATQDAKSPATLPYVIRNERLNRAGQSELRGVTLRNVDSTGASVVMFGVTDVRTR